MNENPPSTCPRCGAELLPGASGAVCPRCAADLLQAQTAATGQPGAAAPFTPPSVAEIAEKFPQLEILSLIGKGGMGAVYKARQPQLDRIVALKILPPGIGDDPAFAERFTREARALAKLSHPNIVTIHDFGQSGGLYFLIMEYVDGITLRRLLETRRVAPREALAIVPEICDALQFAHDQGIVHRDIKPENVLLDRRGRVKVADFGLAKLIGADADIIRAAVASVEGTTLTEAGKVMGTPQYMAPEQRDNPGEVDHRADIYALGVVFYQMLTGELPGKRIEAPSKKVRIDVRLDEIVLRALEQEPGRRYQQASILKTQVETIASTAPRLAAAVGDPENPSAAPLPANRLGAVLAIVGAILQLAALMAGAWAVYNILSDFATASDHEVTNINSLTPGIAHSLFGSLFVWVAFIFGLVCWSIALASARYRAPWFYWVLVIYSWLLLLAFPIGTGFAIFFLIYSFKHRVEFSAAPRNPANGAGLGPRPVPFTAKLSLCLLLLGLLGTPLLLALAPVHSRDAVAVFAALSLLLALVFGIVSRSRLGYGVAIGCVTLFATFGALEWRLITEIDRLDSEMIPKAQQDKTQSAELNGQDATHAPQADSPELKNLRAKLDTAQKQLDDWRKIGVADTDPKVAPIAEDAHILALQVKELEDHPGEPLELVKAKADLWRLGNTNTHPKDPKIAALLQRIKDLEEKRGALPVATAQYSYTPMVERVLNIFPKEVGGYNLETGEFIKYTASKPDGKPEQDWEWQKQFNVGLVNPENSYPCLAGGSEIKVDESAWDEDPVSVVLDLAFPSAAFSTATLAWDEDFPKYKTLTTLVDGLHLLTPAPTHFDYPLPTNDGKNTTYLFRTRNGRIGLMQTSNSPGSKEVKVRWKLVQDATSAKPQAAATPSPESLAEPPQLRCLGWLDEVNANPAWHAWTPAGLPANRRELDLPVQTNYGTTTTRTASKTFEALNYDGFNNVHDAHFLCLWFSHPLFYWDSASEVTLLDDAGKPLFADDPACACNTSAPDPRAPGADKGWVLATIFAGHTGKIPATVTVRLRYTIGPWETWGDIKDFSKPVQLEKGVTATVRQDYSVDVIRDPSQDNGGTEYGFAAVSANGRELSYGNVENGTDEYGAKTRHYNSFGMQLSPGITIRVIMRKFKTIEFKNVTVPKESPLPAQPQTSFAVQHAPPVPGQPQTSFAVPVGRLPAVPASTPAPAPQAPTLRYLAWEDQVEDPDAHPWLANGDLINRPNLQVRPYLYADRDDLKKIEAQDTKSRYLVLTFTLPQAGAREVTEITLTDDKNAPIKSPSKTGNPASVSSETFGGEFDVRYFVAVRYAGERDAMPASVRVRVRYSTGDWNKIPGFAPGAYNAPLGNPAIGLRATGAREDKASGKTFLQVTHDTAHDPGGEQYAFDATSNGGNVIQSDGHTIVSAGNGVDKEEWSFPIPLDQIVNFQCRTRPVTQVSFPISLRPGVDPAAPPVPVTAVAAYKGDMPVYYPSAGTVTQLHVKSGQRTDDVLVSFTIPENMVQQVLKKFQAKQPLPVVVYDANYKKIGEGLVSGTDDKIDTATGTLTLRALITPTGDTILIPGLFLHVKLLQITETGVTLVPAKAVKISEGGIDGFVYLIKPDHTVAILPVALGDDDGKGGMIATGLSPGDIVVLDPPDTLIEGATVSYKQPPGATQPAPPQASATPAAASPAHVSVTGNVVKAGLVEIPAGEKMTVSQAIAKAGGPGQFGDLRKVKLTRKNPDGKPGTVTIIDIKSVLEKGDTANDVELQDGDIIFVPHKLLNFGGEAPAATPR